jgi:hypothetical protein
MQRERVRSCFFLKKKLELKRETDRERETQTIAPFFLFSLCTGGKRE